MATTVYGSATCAPCKTIKYWLDKNNKDYEYKELADHTAEVAKYTTSVSPPIVVKDGEVATNLKDLVKLYGGI